MEWLKVGDKNSKFFHLSTIKRRSLNSILKLKDSSGQWLNETSAIHENISSFFQNLFQSNGDRPVLEALPFIDPKVDARMNALLMAPVTKDEIKEAAFNLGSTKAPGPDGFLGKFYHASWDEISNNVSSMVFEFFDGKSLLHDLNETNITLIPKIPKPECVSHFRPIGLCNFAYKIISKILANRLRRCLDQCISPNQSAFVPGRVIHDNVIIAHEVYHYLRRKKKGGKYEFALKMDMRKAFMIG